MILVFESGPPGAILVLLFLLLLPFVLLVDVFERRLPETRPATVQTGF
jgi:hypothetical protein